MLVRHVFSSYLSIIRKFLKVNSIDLCNWNFQHKLFISLLYQIVQTQVSLPYSISAIEMRIHVRHVLCFQSEDEDAVAKQVKSNTQQNEQANDDEEQAEVCMHRAEFSSIKKIYYLVLWNA